MESLVTSDTAWTRPSLSAQWSALTTVQRCIVVAVFVIGFAALFEMRQSRREERMDILRRQFHLPAEVRIVDFTSGGGKVRFPPFSGVARFTDAQYRDYVRTLDDAAVWSPTPIGYRKIADVARHAPDAYRWRADMPALGYASDKHGLWGRKSEAAVRAMTNGSFFCFAVTPAGGPAAGSPPSGAHASVPCSRSPADEVVLLFVKGALDHETKTLHMIVF